MIRPATLADVDGLKAAIVAAYAPFAEQGIGLPPVAEGLEDDVQNNHVWVADDRGIILGGVVLVLKDGHAHLANLAVHPDWAGQGLGRDLIDTVLHAAKAAGHENIVLTTHVDMAATIAFYAKLGWTELWREDDKVRMTTSLL